MDISKPTQPDWQVSDCSKTQYGLTCQRWDKNSPHIPKSKPIVDMHNFCSNPDGDKNNWCYTTDPNVRWDYCHPKCEVIRTTTTTKTTTTTTTTTTATSPTPAIIRTLASRPTSRRPTNHNMVIYPVYSQCGAQSSNYLKSKTSVYSPSGHCYTKCHQSIGSSMSTSFNGGTTRSLSPTGWISVDNKVDFKVYNADGKAKSIDFPWFVRVGMGFSLT